MLINKNNLTNLTMIEIVKLSSKGQLVIPERVRKKIKLKEGSRLVLNVNNNQLLLQPEEEYEKKLKKLKERKEDKGWMLLGMQGMDIWKEDTYDWGKLYDVKK